MEDVFILEDLDTLRTIADSRRLFILHLLQEPLTATQVAERMGEPTNTIYYHITELEKRGLLRLVETRLKGHLTEKYFQAVARTFIPSHTLIESHFDTLLEASEQFDLRVLDTLGLEIRRAFSSGAIRPDNIEESYFSQVRLSLTPAQVNAFGDRLEEVVKEFEALQDPNLPARALLTILLHPIAGIEPNNQTPKE
jgi:DNA-binding transcriptional ArsR family regulator